MTSHIIFQHRCATSSKIWSRNALFVKDEFGELAKKLREYIPLVRNVGCDMFLCDIANYSVFVCKNKVLNFKPVNEEVYEPLHLSVALFVLKFKRIFTIVLWTFHSTTHLLKVCYLKLWVMAIEMIGLRYISSIAFKTIKFCTNYT